MVLLIERCCVVFEASGCNVVGIVVAGSTSADWMSLSVVESIERRLVLFMAPAVRGGFGVVLAPLLFGWDGILVVVAGSAGRIVEVAKVGLFDALLFGRFVCIRIGGRLGCCCAH